MSLYSCYREGLPSAAKLTIILLVLLKSDSFIHSFITINEGRINMMRSLYFPAVMLVLACTSMVDDVTAFAPLSRTTATPPPSFTRLHYRGEYGDHDYSQGNLKYGTGKYTARIRNDAGVNMDAANIGPMGRSLQYNVQRDSDRAREFESMRHYGRYDDEFSPEFLGRMDDRMMYHDDFEAERHFGGRMSPRERAFGFRGDDYFRGGAFRDDSDPILRRTSRSARDGGGFNPTDPINRRSRQQLFDRRQEGRDYFGEGEFPMGGRGAYDPRELRSRFGSRRGPNEEGANGGLLRDHFKYN